LTLAKELELDPSSQTLVESDASTARKVDILRKFADRESSKKNKTLRLRFLVSPTELLDDGTGAVGSVQIVQNRLVSSDNGRIRPEPTDRFETLPAGLVFRSVGYRGVPLPEIPFRDDWGTVPNCKGRVLETVDGNPLPGIFVTGWIKRGPSGVIGTNKPDAVETVACMVEDFAKGQHFDPKSSRDEIEELLTQREVPFVSYADWQRIDAHELALGKQRGRPRIKMIRASEISELLGSDPA
jgi:ferredoxin--NADP+ reductase